jgi:hypothetical protein
MDDGKDPGHLRMETGDHFTGRCASLLNMYRKDFGSSPVLFDGVDPVWATQAMGDKFPCFLEIDGISWMLVMLLARLTHHGAVMGEFSPSHIARTIPLFWDGWNLIPAIVNAWEGTHTVTGVPPHHGPPTTQLQGPTRLSGAAGNVPKQTFPESKRTWVGSI